jgi:hypothetical protein
MFKELHSRSDLCELSIIINSLTLIIRKFEDGVVYLVVRYATEGRAYGQITLTSGTAPTLSAAMMFAGKISVRTETTVAEPPQIVGLTYTEHSGTIRKGRDQRSRPFHILIIEHESAFFDVLQTMLEKDYQVTFARTVVEAQAIVQASRVDVALVGSVFPDGQGADFTALAQRLGAAVIEMRSQEKHRSWARAPI